MMSVYLIIGDVDFDHLDMVMPARFLYGMVAVFPFIVNKKYGGDPLKMFEYPASLSNFYPLVLASIDILIWINYKCNY